MFDEAPVLLLVFVFGVEERKLKEGVLPLVPPPPPAEGEVKEFDPVKEGKLPVELKGRPVLLLLLVFRFELLLLLFRLLLLPF